ncbi:serine/threonine protein kinase [Stigmatella sp. ncwal1]|uniref:Serine/threonine protein kinase n=1 Tax=Stigmatella ashevillensis TaxID=2995309 RepID=A0ABT5D7S7_9BACT|nr:serine/threonine-protein kinase [Stigmatella ashevillena]MDC0708331.1 serine/threonine protein kinase [Stigmatella ashevillena]
MAIQAGSPGSDPDRGRRIGKYEILTRLSVGGMAELFLAFTSGPGGFRKFVALKQILPDVKTEEFVKMFLDEARITAALTHANIGQVFDLGEEDSELYLAMDFLAGQNLDQLVKAAEKRGEPLPSGFAARVIRDVCLALHYAHHFVDPTGRSVSVVHRDMSPRNVMVTYDGGVKVIDFGIAKAKGRLGRTAVGMVKGTGGYMSPEQVRGQELDGRSDLFCSGVLLHEMLCGQRLFNAPGDAAMMLQIVEGDLPTPHELNPEVPEALSAVVMRALTREKSKRFATGREMAKAIEAAMGAELFDEERLAALMQEFFSDKRDKTRALLEYASRDDARIKEVAGALRDEPGESAPSTRAKTTPLPRPRVPSSQGVSGRQGATPRPRKPVQEHADPAATTVPPRGARSRPPPPRRVEASTHDEAEDPRTLPPSSQPTRVRPSRSPSSVSHRPSDRARMPSLESGGKEAGSKSKWGVRLFWLAFLGGLGGLLALEPVRAALRPGYESAVAKVKAELELGPPPQPPEQAPWPPPARPPPPNPLAPKPDPEPATVAEAPPSEPSGSDAPEEPVVEGDDKSSATRSTTKAGTSRSKQKGTQAKVDPRAQSGAAEVPAREKTLEEKLAVQPETTLDETPAGEAQVVDTTSKKGMRKAGIGLLSLSTVPPAAVFDGNTSLGTTPLRKVPLQVGTYRLRIVDSEGQSRLFSAPVELAKERKYTIRVSDLPLYPD